MVNLKKTVAMGLVLAAVSISSVSVSAATNSTSTYGYGTLYGSLTSSGSYVTSVQRNNDLAKLTIAGSIQDRAGNTLVSKQTIYSDRGDTYLSGAWTGIPSNAYAIYGTHGVQNGTTYGAAAIYTVTHVS